MNIKDAAARSEALNPAQSFIVQAPAGSGKTELLTQRFLNLLTTVDKNPEEVLAITFTRKAANEMRQRILSALQMALGEKPTSAHKKTTYDIAQKVLQRSQQEQWDLLDNPNRLRIQTIDSLCAYLSKQLPLLSQLGASVNITENPKLHYQQAVEKTLVSLESDLPWSDSIAQLLLHCDNNLRTVKYLLTTMLAHRDQWLGHVIRSRNNAALRTHLEMALQRLITDTLQETHKTFSPEIQNELLSLLNYVSQTDLSVFPTAHIADLPQWQALANLLLTSKFEWRKTITAKNGFPVKSSNKEEQDYLRSMKERMLEVLNQLQNNEFLRTLLKEILLLPPAAYDDQQWQILTALLELLPVLAAELNLCFQQSGEVDFVEITQRALQALEHEDMPSDLALCLDYKIKHILVDEFQDTSATQFHLLELLTQGWQKDDGHSLFLVGDPMQSIYRFRAAEVGLFLQAKQYGIGNIPLKSLTLTSNFRSITPIVDWFNHTFVDAFPQNNNIALGAIAYSAADAVHAVDAEAIYYHQCLQDNESNEAATVKSIIQENTDKSIAILVKSRHQLSDIIAQLKQDDIPFQAVEIETLAHVPFIQDLCSLSLAMAHFGNRLAWLSILRAPWCGLCLQDLHALANKEPQKTLWALLNDTKLQQKLTPDGLQRVQNFLNIMHPLLEQRGRFSFSQWVKNAWQQLGGPATLRDYDNLNDSTAFFDLLETLSTGAMLTDFVALEEGLQSLYATPKSQQACVQVMTIHKSKGLEFDVVILPSLQSFSATDKSKLLLWQERPSQDRHLDLLLAPIKAHKDDNDPIYDYVKHFEKRKSFYENTRLFYVAATRAKKQLHLLASFEDIEKRPRASSFLECIWDAHKHNFKTYYNINTAKAEVNVDNLRRLSLDFKLPQSVKNALPQLQLTTTINTNMPVWQDDDARKTGIVIHYLLQQLSLCPADKWGRIIKNHLAIEILLRQQGVNNIEASLEKVCAALKNITQGDLGPWILDCQHQHAHSEYSLGVGENVFVIDRTFIADGVRWVIDYKTSEPEMDQDLAAFLQQEQARYCKQLEHYASLFDGEGLPVKLMLYFPLLNVEVDWEYLGVVRASSHA